MNSATGRYLASTQQRCLRHLNRVVWPGDHYWVVGDDGKVLTSENGNIWSP